MTGNLNEVLNQATKKIAGLIQKSLAKGVQGKVGRTAEDLENLLRTGDFE